jgi:16S rRNA (adenine1518-N6/adenine1519-N6)-dimethyltransferase
MRASIEFVKNALNALQKSPNRALGQNFCIDGERLSACVDRMTVCKSAIEIGPGLGGFTELLLPRCETLTAVEKDEAMAAYLKDTLPDPKLSVVHGDALKFRYADVPAPFSVVGNLPYYITTPLCSAVLKALPASFYCMVQKEAADRFFAAPKDDGYGPLSILVQLYYDAKTLAAFPPDCFFPSPDVQSVFVGMTKKPNAPQDDPNALFAFCAQLLSMRRKTIKNNLKPYPNAAEVLETLGISPETRAETLPPETFLALCRML